MGSCVLPGGQRWTEQEGGELVVQWKETGQSGAGARRSLSPPSGRPREQMERRCENSRVGVGKYVTAQTPEGGPKRSDRPPHCSSTEESRREEGAGCKSCC